MIAEGDERRLVFIFLDEGVPDISKELEQWSIDFPEYSFQLIPFPSSFRSMAIFDFQLVLFMRREIMAVHSKTGDLFFRGEYSPIFIFFTTDGNFVEDVKIGFAKTKKPKKKKRDIAFDGQDGIIYKIRKINVRLSILPIWIGYGKEMIRHMREKLSSVI